jgi:HEAT repeat protein
VAALRRFQPYAADDGKAIPLLIRTLGDADPRVSRAAADALVLLGSAARGPLSAALSDSSAVIRQGAAAALVRLGRAGP